MADDAQSIRSLNWRELFPFTHLFRAFRIAIHPSKLVLGFALLFLVYSGGRVLDWIWPTSQYAVYKEIDGYDEYRWSTEKTLPFSDMREIRKLGIEDEYKRRLLELKIVPDDAAATAAAKAGDYKTKLLQSVVQARNNAFKDAEKLRDDTNKDLPNQKLTDKERIEKKQEINQHYEDTIRKEQANMDAGMEDVRRLSPQPLFDTFFDYEVRQFHNIVDSALTFNWLNGVFAPTATAGHERPDAAALPKSNMGVVRAIANLTVTGPGWLLRYHIIYFVLFVAWFLICWAVFGGAIARIAAVHVARDEKISVRQALRFSTNKLLSYIFAPIIPLIIIVIVGGLVALGGLLMYVSVLGPILVSIFFFLPLLAGFVITLVGTGTVAGFNLMYPTIAVEGSDSFDAISRSFSYVFARPWRMVFYTALSLVYGALCFLFVRYFVYVMLGVTHFFVQWFLGGQPGRYWPEIWPVVSDENLAYRINFQALSWADAAAAFIIAMWVYLILTLMAAFVMSFYFSSNTIIYFLMRREVDATELDDVYVEESDEDFSEPPTAPVVAAAAPVAPTPIVTEVIPPAPPVEPPPAPAV